jgi:hypothetical protein
MDRNSSSEAKDIIDKFLPEKKIRYTCLSMFAESIERAHSHGGGKWGVTIASKKDRVRFNVGNLVLCTLQKNSYWLALSAEDPKVLETLKELQGWTTEKKEGYSSIPSIWGYYDPSNNYHSQVWPIIRGHHFRLIDGASEKYFKLSAKSEKAHSPGMLKYMFQNYKLLSRKIVDSKNGDDDIQTQEPPINLEPVILKINELKKYPDHTEKAHETLVTMFYEKLGYSNLTEIKYQIGSIDISINVCNKPMIVNEVKKDWNLSYPKNIEVVKQAYNYANTSGARFVVITNADYYALFDQDRPGHSYDDHLVGDFTLTKLTKEDFELINSLKKESMIANT